MKRRLLVLLIPLALILTPLAQAETVLYCQEEASVGFVKVKESGEWKGSSFKLVRYTVHLSNDLTTLKTNLTGYPTTFKCEDAGNRYENALICINQSHPSQQGFSFSLNKSLDRFMRAHHNLWSYTLDGTDTASIGIGTCERF